MHNDTRSGTARLALATRLTIACVRRTLLTVAGAAAITAVAGAVTPFATAQAMQSTPKADRLPSFEERAAKSAADISGEPRNGGETRADGTAGASTTNKAGKTDKMPPAETAFPITGQTAHEAAGQTETLARKSTHPPAGKLAPAAPATEATSKAETPGTSAEPATLAPATTASISRARATPAASPPAPPPGEIQWSRGRNTASRAAPGAPQSATAPAPGAPSASAPSASAASPMPVADRFNLSGRALDLTAPLRDGAFFLGDVEIRISPQDEISVSTERLAQTVAPILRPGTLDALKLVPASGGYATLPALKAAGFALSFDTGRMEMQFAPTIEQRATGRLSMGSTQPQTQSANLSPPAALASYLNMRAGADYTTTTFYGDEGSADARIGFDGATRWQDVVFESAATYDMMGGFTRGDSRFVFDMPEDTLRVSAGDVTPLKSAFQGSGDLLGVSVEKSFQKLQPSASIRPTGNQSFRIERPSTVDVIVNGQLAQRMQLRPGDYDMSDLPLAAGANDIELAIEDDLGSKRTLNFSTFSGRSLLAPGIAEWAFNAGVASHVNAGQKDYRNLYGGVEYDFAAPVVSGYYERGLTTDITGSIHLQADSNAIMSGTGASFQTPIGFWSVDGALSHTRLFGSGLAGRIDYELANIRNASGTRRSFRAAAEYRSEQFAAAAAHEPENSTMATLSAAYTQDLPWDLSGNISGSYQLGRGQSADRYGVNVSLGRSFGQALSAGINAGYQETLAESGADTLSDGFKAAIRLAYSLDDASNLDATYDARYGQSQIGYRHQEGSGTGSWNAHADISRAPGGNGDDSDSYTANGALAYTAARAEMAVSQRTALAGIDTGATSQRTSVTAGSAIAFADGRFALGHPISNGFAIVETHASLPDSDVIIGTEDASRAASGLFGPALVTDLSPFSPSTVSYDVSNLPPGYDLGAGAFDLLPGYKSGYRLTVGSDYTVTAIGTLTDAAGTPITLITGTAREDGQPESREITVFTNRSGKFSAQGLRPGRWVLDMATDPKTRFTIDIPAESVGIVTLGTLKPAGGA